MMKVCVVTSASRGIVALNAAAGVWTSVILASG